MAVPGLWSWSGGWGSAMGLVARWGLAVAVSAAAFAAGVVGVPEAGRAG